jgi:hypothetical protein
MKMLKNIAVLVANKQKERNKVLDALNRIDELACYAVQDNDNGEAEQLEKDYNMVFDFIKNA